MRTMMMLAGTALAVVASAACDTVRDFRDGDRGRLALSLETPGMLDWGATGTIRVAILNQGGSEVEGARIEMYLPTWLEFGPVEPAGTAVTLVSGETGTRLSYAMPGRLQPGERRDVVQHVRVPPAPGDTGVTQATNDTAPARAPPADRVVRARLLDARGAVVGAEVQAVLSFRGATDEAGAAAGPQPPPVLSTEGVGTLRVGMTLDELQRALPGARDTTITDATGAQHRALLVPVTQQARVAAIVADRGLERIIVRDSALRTDRDLGVGSRLRELRDAYGRVGCVLPAGERVAVRFNAAPALRFALSARMPPADTAGTRADIAQLPDTSRVVEMWVGTDAAMGEC